MTWSQIVDTGSPPSWVQIPDLQTANWQNVNTTAKGYIVTESGLKLLSESSEKLITETTINSEWVNINT